MSTGSGVRFVDTNIFLRYFTRDDEEKAENVLHLLKRVESGEEKVAVSPLVVFETIFTLERHYDVSKKDIGDLLTPLLGLKGLKLEFKDIFESALELYSENKYSFADAFNACFMRKAGIDEIYSYDEDFDKIKQLKRIIP